MYPVERKPWNRFPLVGVDNFKSALFFVLGKEMAYLYVKEFGDPGEGGNGGETLLFSICEMSAGEKTDFLGHRLEGQLLRLTKFFDFRANI